MIETIHIADFRQFLTKPHSRESGLCWGRRGEVDADEGGRRREGDGKRTGWLYGEEEKEEEEEEESVRLSRGEEGGATTRVILGTGKILSP